MNKQQGLVCISLLSLLGYSPVMAQSLDSMIDGFFNQAFGWFVELIFSSVPIAGVQFPLIVGWLGVGALVFTVYFGFPQLKYLKIAINLVRGKYDGPEKEKEDGEVSHFRALTTALSGTVGLGNIAGVGVALAIGGPGATFWMIMVGLFGMASKFIECTLGVKYRTILPSGAVSGGPMYYLSKGLAEQGLPRLGKILAFGFAVMTIFGALGAGNMFQSNQANAMLVQAFGLPDGYGWLFGMVLAVFVYGVVVGGMPSIASVTARLVPFMAGLYLTMAFIVIVLNMDKVPAAFAAIFTGAFTGEGVAGGIIGVFIQGMRRATFSNEAGAGSAAIAHSAVKTKEPVTEGMVGLLEPFIDTVVVCTISALVITIAGLNIAPFNGSDLTGIALTAASFQQTFDWFRYPLALVVILFAISTMITWCYYGLKGWTYLVGEGRVKEYAFKIFFCFFIIIGAASSLNGVINFSDAAFFSMAIFNIAGLYLLMPKVKEELRKFVAKVQSGEFKEYS
jgi:AGCS family alanine or glycine:cation symporter